MKDALVVGEDTITSMLTAAKEAGVLMGMTAEQKLLATR